MLPDTVNKDLARYMDECAQFSDVYAQTQQETPETVFAGKLNRIAEGMDSTKVSLAIGVAGTVISSTCPPGNIEDVAGMPSTIAKGSAGDFVLSCAQITSVRNQVERLPDTVIQNTWKNVVNKYGGDPGIVEAAKLVRDFRERLEDSRTWQSYD